MFALVTTITVDYLPTMYVETKRMSAENLAPYALAMGEERTHERVFENQYSAHTTPWPRCDFFWKLVIPWKIRYISTIKQ